MKQSRGTSLWKSVISTGIGFGVAMVANVTVLPLFGFHPSLIENLQITTIYTVISIARGYGVERLMEAVFGRVRMSAAMFAVIAERLRQINGEGWSAEHDDAHPPGELACAGAAYAQRAKLHLTNPTFGSNKTSAEAYCPNTWPWDLQWWKPQDFRRDLIKAAALILAEIERFDRRRKRKPADAPGAPA